MDWSAAEVAVPDGACAADAVGAGDDCAAVGEDREFYGAVVCLVGGVVVCGLVVEGDGEVGGGAFCIAERCEGAGELVEVRRLGRGWQLDGVLAAERFGVVWSGCVEVCEVALAAAGAVRVAGCWAHIDAAELCVPGVEDEHVPAEFVVASEDDLEGFGGLERGDGGCDRGEDAGGVAGLGCAGRRRGWDELPEARRRLVGGAVGAGARWREYGREHGACADGGGVDERCVVLDGGVVEDEPGVEVVRAVEDDPRGVGCGEPQEVFGVMRVEVRGVGVDRDGAVDGGECALGGDGLWCAGLCVAFCVEGLALEVCCLDEVAVDDGECADAGACEEFRADCAEGAEADDDGVRVSECADGVFAEVREEGLAVEASVGRARVRGRCGGVTVHAMIVRWCVRRRLS